MELLFEPLIQAYRQDSFRFARTCAKGEPVENMQRALMIGQWSRRNSRFAAAMRALLCLHGRRICREKQQYKATSNDSFHEHPSTTRTCAETSMCLLP